MKRTILHCDLNCFFASVEMLYNPELRKVPMAVAGDPKFRHGIILAKNVPAKRKGVKTAETINEALQKCPELIIRRPDYPSYQYFSDRVRSLYEEYTDKVEPFGIDECWLDITESIRYFGSAEKIVKDLLYRVRNEIGLTLSIGQSFNKVYAKLGSDLAAENCGKKISSLAEIRDLPADRLLGVGYSTYERLKSYNIFTIGDLAEKPLDFLHGILGKNGETLYCYANGMDLSEVEDTSSSSIPKSISNSMTPSRDLYDMDDVRLVLTILSDSVAARLVEQGMYFSCVHLYVRNSRLQIRSMQTSLRENSDLAGDIFQCAVRLFEENCDFSMPYRSLGVAVSRLSFAKQISQTDLFGNEIYSLKRKKEEKALEEIRRRFGYKAAMTLRILEDQELSGMGPDDDCFFPDENFRR
ncbi:MAG: DNA polymerase IV [Erysipelotrichaceae bacterium]|nr:DNA polymerase IV [Erysipelotrichaceae bacterium]